MFGFGKKLENEPDIIDSVKKDFGDRFGGDLSLLVLEHYKATGSLLSTKDIDLDTVQELKTTYMDKVMETQGLYETYSGKFK